ncbi:MAG TPA: hypothetical protein VHP83_06385 [Aggregatilineaceae bacterium]|nr:hypothetical protein [Aggregatilineaceae bacterium]
MMEPQPFDSPEWLNSFDDLFIGLDESAVIRRVVGVPHWETSETIALEGLSWADFTMRYADPEARSGLHYSWLAVVERRVAPHHWPPFLYFRNGWKIALRATNRDGLVAFAAHIFPSVETQLNNLLGQQVLTSIERLVRVSQHLYRGTDGPLTDSQVSDVGKLVEKSEYLYHLLHRARAEWVLPTLSAPQPYSLPQLFQFSNQDFIEHRVKTQQLNIECQWSSEVVYCYKEIRSTVQAMLHDLLVEIPAQTSIKLTDTVNADDGMIWVEISYQGKTPETLAMLLTVGQAYLSPVKGRVWSEPAQNRIILAFPRWQGSR